ncbi:MAG TPA: ABC transporter permease [Cyclobacteriaceae bacterium]|nr:ABC transporter permease [Cyclobacteriaceae bacterium]
MIKSYIKVVFRSILRNKLFSSINIIGLGISMSVGLLLITFLADLISYDRFHDKGDRIYRVFTSSSGGDAPNMRFASTSVRAGMEIKASASGVKQVVMLRRGFGGNVKVDGHNLFQRGMWATESFFDVFSFKLIDGDAATALKEPYSIVLTERSAHRIFGNTDVVGKTIQIDTSNYKVTGLMEDVPKLSHMKFEALVSFSTVELISPDADGGFLSWRSIFQTYVYLLLPEKHDVGALQANLDKISERENAALDRQKIMLHLQPMLDIALGENLVNPIGQTMPKLAVWILVGLSAIVLISACFNFTNLSLASLLRRSRDAGIRKVVGGLPGHILRQNLLESIVISLIALLFAVIIFLLIRPQFLLLTPFLSELISMNISLVTALCFIGLAIFVGLIAGIIPSVVLSRINPLQVLADASGMKVYGKISLRKLLVIIQYVFSLIFIVTTLMGYKQYRYFLDYDLGFNTENIINIHVRPDKADRLNNELSQLSEVEQTSRSLMLNGIASFSTIDLKYKDPQDSARVFYNTVSQGYLPLHDYQFIAGGNFKPSGETADHGVVVNEELLKRFSIGSPLQAIGEFVVFKGEKFPIIGVVKDFHHGTLETRIGPFVFRNAEKGLGVLNVKINGDWSVAIAKMDNIWKTIDDGSPLQASVYTDEIRRSYQPYVILTKVTGFLAFLAVCIASIGLFGMAVFGTDARKKEISIRKVMGASETTLVVFLSKGFFILIGFASLLAFPITYIFFSRVVFPMITYHAQLTAMELGEGLIVVTMVAFIMVCSQTIKAAKANPGRVLRKD